MRIKDSVKLGIVIVASTTLLYGCNSGGSGASGSGFKSDIAKLLGSSAEKTEYKFLDSNNKELSTNSHPFKLKA